MPITHDIVEEDAERWKKINRRRSDNFVRKKI